MDSSTHMDAWRRARGSARTASVWALLSLLAWTPAARAVPQLPTGFNYEPVVSGLTEPVGMAFLPDGRLLLVEQRTARVRLIVNGALSSTDPVATIPGIQSSGAEQGLLGIAVDPGWPARPYVYVHACDLALGKIRVSRYTVAGDLANTGNGALTIDPGTRLDLVRDVPDNAGNHNGGSVRFGIDGMLYVSLGEDANACAAQDSTSLRGVILRLDVSRLEPDRTLPAPRALVIPPGNPFAAHPDSNARLVWELGLRNPFRIAIDPTDGVLWIADVGNNVWEEVDRAPAGGINFGWPWREGPDDFLTCSEGGTGTAPVYYYPDGTTAAAIIMAGPYRAPGGATTPFPAEYDGNVFFAEYYVGFLRRLTGSGDSWTLASPVDGQPNASNWGAGLSHISDWAVGPDGAWWYCQQSNELYQANTGMIGRIAFTDDTSVPPTVPRVQFRPVVPSPSHGGATFRFSLPVASRVRLVIHDVGGRVVRVLIDGESRDPGDGEAFWNGRDDDGRAVGAGIYVARLEVGGAVLERRVSFLR